jgi:hypothetical protein
MQTESVIPSVLKGKAAMTDAVVQDELADFSTDRGVLLLSAMALAIGAFGSFFAQQFHLSAAERKTLLVAGAAAGMSAVFAMPVAAVWLAVELLLFEQTKERDGMRL